MDRFMPAIPQRSGERCDMRFLVIIDQSIALQSLSAPESAATGVCAAVRLSSRILQSLSAPESAATSRRRLRHPHFRWPYNPSALRRALQRTLQDPYGREGEPAIPQRSGERCNAGDLSALPTCNPSALRRALRRHVLVTAVFALQSLSAPESAATQAWSGRRAMSAFLQSLVLSVVPAIPGCNPSALLRALRRESAALVSSVPPLLRRSLLG